MASKDDSPTSLHGQPWSVWADRLGRDSPLSDTDEQSKVNQTKEGDAMKLPKQDMSFYGLCPVRDEFYLVTCNYCQRVCTPQGLKNHIELKHAQEWTSCQSQLPESLDNCVHPTAAAPVSSSAKAKATKKAATGQSAMPTSLAYLLASPAAPLKPRGGSGGTSSKRVSGSKPASSAASNIVSHGPANKIPTPIVSALTGTSYDKVPSPQQPPPVQFSPLQPTLTAPSPVSPLTAGGPAGTGVMTPSPAITMTVAVDSSGNQTVQIHLPEIGNGVMLADSPADLGASVSNACGSSGVQNRSGKKQRKTSKSERRMLPVKERELDLEKHCGVWMSDLNRACTRSLTCKAHSLTLRRAVQGRSRPFDDLLAEHRAVKESVTKQGKDGANLPAGAAHQPVAKPTLSNVVPCQASAVPKLGRPPLVRPPPAKKLLTSLLQSQPQPAVGSELSVEVLPLTESQNVQHLPSSGLLTRVFPSTVMPAVSLTFTPHHPKPLAVCSFGLRRHVSRASAAPDRKWDFLRSTVRSTLKRSAASSAVRSISTASGTLGLQSLLRPSITQPSSSHHLMSHESNSIELPNGLQLSIGVQPEGHNHHHHRARLKKSLLNGVTGGHPTEQEQADDLMEGFDGLVGEDGVLTFLNQTSEGTASLSLMADLSAGNITFSELNHQAGGGGGNVSAGPRLHSTSTSLLLQPDPGDPM
ncbi:ataxin-7-like protein 1 [Daphnia carinata]|uniref:ataxin-7-like protein 1 n=1 Tax=Daphnia carinata TaxID=120202 RepID=UPI00257A7AE0|nr:ataxin-7-like protein 1 [Daphnia carinata]